MIACENSGHVVANDFAEVSKIVKAGAISKSIKDLENIFEMVLTRLTLVLSPFRLRNALHCYPLRLTSHPGACLRAAILGGSPA